MKSVLIYFAILFSFIQCLSEFKRSKFNFILNVFLDSDKNGIFDENDIKILVESIAIAEKLDFTDPRFGNYRYRFTMILDGMKDEIKTRSEGITRSEWIKLWENFNKDSSKLSVWNEMYRQLVFDLTDKNSNNLITRDEFVPLNSFFGTAENAVYQAFLRASRNTSVINREEYKGLWVEYFTSEDPDAAGNFITGVSKYL